MNALLFVQFLVVYGHNLTIDIEVEEELDRLVALTSINPPAVVEVKTRVLESAESLNRDRELNYKLFADDKTFSFTREDIRPGQAGLPYDAAGCSFNGSVYRYVPWKSPGELAVQLDESGSTADAYELHGGIVGCLIEPRHLGMSYKDISSSAYGRVPDGGFWATMKELVLQKDMFAAQLTQAEDGASRLIEIWALAKAMTGNRWAVKHTVRIDTKNGRPVHYAFESWPDYQSFSDGVAATAVHQTTVEWREHRSQQTRFWLPSAIDVQENENGLLIYHESSDVAVNKILNSAADESIYDFSALELEVGAYVKVNNSGYSEDDPLSRWDGSRVVSGKPANEASFEIPGSSNTALQWWIVGNVLVMAVILVAWLYRRIRQG